MKHRYQIEMTEGSLAGIREKVRNISEERIFDGLSSCMYNLEKVKNLTNQISRIVLDMIELEPVFCSMKDLLLFEWATIDNEFFQKGKLSLDKTNVLILGIKRLFIAFCKNTKRRGPIKDGKEVSIDAITDSFLSRNNVQLHVWGKETYRSEVHKLLEIMKEFCQRLNSLLSYCVDVIKEIERIQKDPKTCLPLYQNQFEETRKLLSTIIDNLQDCVLEEDEISRLKRESISDESFAANYYLKFDKSEFFSHVLYSCSKIVGKKNCSNTIEPTPYESLLLGDDIPKIQLIRHLIADFDRLVDCDNKHKVNRCFGFFYKWCINKVFDPKAKTKRDFYNYFYSFYNGKHRVVPISTFYNISSNLNDGDEYNSFVKKIELLQSVYDNNGITA